MGGICRLQPELPHTGKTLVTHSEAKLRQMLVLLVLPQARVITVFYTSTGASHDMGHGGLAHLCREQDESPALSSESRHLTCLS